MRSLLAYIDEEAIMEDEYLVSFLRDCGGVFTMIWSAIEFLLGLSYICGKHLTETLVAAWYFTINLGGSFGAALEAFALLIADIATGILKSFCLLYYGFFKIIEAFQITFVDFITFLGHVGLTIGNLILNGLQTFADTILALGLVPKQLLAALILFSETFLDVSNFLLRVVWNFMAQLILSPFNAVIILSKLFFKIVLVLLSGTGVFLNSILSIPLSVHLVLIVCTCIYMTYRKVSLRVLVRTVVRVIRSTFRIGGIIGKLISTKMARFFKVEPSELEGADDREEETFPAKGMCVICQDAPVGYVSHPCCHVCLCSTCVYKLVKTDNRCPLCRNVVDNFTRVYIS